MQFRSPFRPSPPDQVRQPREFPRQHQVYSQQQQFYPPPIMQTQSLEKKSRKPFWFVIAAVACVLALVTTIGSFSAYISSTEHPQTAAVTTRAQTQVEHPALQSTPAGNATTTAGNLQNVKPTHGSPALDGQISDFIGTYGKPSTTNGIDSMWLLNTDGSLALDARDTGKGVVGYVSLSIPDSWSKQRAQAFCLAFAPHHYTPYKTSQSSSTADLYVYNSPNGRFALHISPGYPLYCFMNTI